MYRVVRSYIPHRSIKTDFVTLGVAVVIGVSTNKVLQVVPKNSSCHCCKVSPDNKTHTCKKNHIGSAGSMESKGIVEAFEAAPEKYGCYYMEYVGDGDSTVADSIVCNVSFQEYTYSNLSYVKT